jgi:hypothetical protein
METTARMESFVWYIVTGGFTLVVGQWLFEFGTAWTRLWGAGVALAVLGSLGLAAGIGSEIEY